MTTATETGAGPVTFDSAAYRRGVDVLEAVGASGAGLQRWQRVDPVVGPVLDRMLGEFCFGDVWARDGLDLRTRRVVTLTTIAALGRPTLLKVHIKGALDQGMSRRDVLEVFVHMIAYAGFPVALSSIEVAEAVFAELDAAAAGPHAADGSDVAEEVGP
ncbi:MAG: carboxymuconolactone decarboxylase family protein [Acidimicrobiales bacterium]